MSERFFLIAAITSIIGLILLTYASDQLYPPYTNIADVSADLISQNIRVQAHVCRIHEFDGGSMMITLCKNDTELDLFLSYHLSHYFNKKMIEGKNIDVVGTVEVYKGKIELIVNNPQDLVIIK